MIFNHFSFAVPGLLVAETGLSETNNLRGIGNTFGSSSLVGMYIDEASVLQFLSIKLTFEFMILSELRFLKAPKVLFMVKGL